MSQRKKIIIIGAGPAGLAAAWELARKGQEIIVLEKQDQVGGISKTINHNGYRFDTGGHRFWTKDKEVQDFWQQILGDEFLTRPRLSRIFYKNKFFYYPLKALNALINLGVVESLCVILNYAYTKIVRFLKPRVAVNYEQWISDRFGKRLYQIFFETYTQKVWGITPDKIGAEWAAQRIQNLSLIRAIIDALGLSKKGKVKTLIDEFQYPKFGPGQMYDQVAEEIKKKGGQIRIKTEVVGVNILDNTIKSIIIKDKNGQNELSADSFISSMPLSELIQNMLPNAPTPVLMANKKLWYRNLITVNFIIDKKDVMPDTWIYIHDQKIKAGRLQNFKNWSPFMSLDENKTNVGLEYFSTRGDEIDNLSDNDLIKLGKEDWAKLGLGNKDNIEDAFVVRVYDAYPVYQIGYYEALNEVVNYVKQFDNLQIIGRGGMYRYNNMDHSILTGLYAARNILGGNYDIFKVNADESYLEYKDDR